MPAIRIGTRTLQLAAEAQLALERNSTWLAPRDQNGSFSLPFKAPFTADQHNSALLGAPERFDHAGRPPRRYEPAQAFDEDGNLVASGTATLQGVEADGYSLNLVTGLSAVMQRLKSKKLREFWFGGPRPVAAGSVSTWGQLSDLLGQHMLAVVDNVAAYDYVFAPFSNNDAYADHDSDAPRWANMNQWLNSGFQVHNGYAPPAPGAPDPSMVFDAATVTSCVPLPKLPYVLRTIFEELEITLETDLFEELEMQQLVVLSTTPIEYNANWFDWSSGTPALIDLRFRLGNQLPDITAHEFVRRLADTFYLDLDLTPAGTVRLRRTDRLATARPARDLTRLVGPGFTRDLAELAVRATYTTGDDAVAGELYQEVDPALVGAPVNIADELPAAPSQPGELRLVLASNTYYQYESDGWRPYSVHLPPVQVGPGTDTVQDVAQGITLTLDQNVLPAPGGSRALRVPTLGERNYCPLLGGLTRSTQLRLAFYRGTQPLQGIGTAYYPMLSGGNANANYTRIGNHTLYLDGEDGLVAHFGRFYLQMLAEQPAKFPAYLTGQDFAQLNFGEPVSIRGDVFLLRRANVVLPVTRAGTLELVPRREYTI